MTYIFKKNKMFIFAALAPALIIYTFFVLYPVIRSFVFGFYDWNGLSAPQFIGLENFKNIFKDKIFWLSFKNNMFIILISILCQIPLGILVALALGGATKGAAFFRTAFFMPVILSTVVTGILMSIILNARSGLLNIFLQLFNAAPVPDLLGNPSYAIRTLSLVILWQFAGLYVILFLSALKNIPAEISEAADIDGAGEITKFFKLRLPLLRGTIASAVVLCISCSMRTFDLIYVMTGGGPAYSSEVMATYIYNKTFPVYQYGYGSAASLVVAVFSFLLIAISRTLLLRKAEEGGV